MKQHTTLKHRLTVLAILFAPPFLVVGAMQALFWLLYRLFPSTPLSFAWLGIERYAATVLGAHVLISAGLMWLLVRRRERAERWQFVLTAVAVPLAMPFLAFWPLSLLMRLSYRLFPSSFTPWLFFGVEMYPFLSTSLLSDVTRYLILSLAALILTLSALTWLAAQERRQVWRRGRFCVLLAAFAAVLTFPFLMRYKPAVQAAPGVELRLVEQPGLIEGAVRSCRAAAEISGCQYEPLGWADAQTLVYRKWCGGHYDETGVWYPGSPGAPLLYDVRTGKGGVSLVDRAPWHEICDPAVCVSPMLAGGEYFPPPHYLPGHFKDAVISPDGRWVAFTAEHIYGPEDLLVISSE